MDSETSEKCLLEPFLYLCSHPGKEIRSQLIEAFDHWLRVPAGDLEVIKSVVEMLHNASLLVDDVEDDSLLRRGKPVAHKIYGTAQTINCANYVYFLALQKLLTLSRNQAAVIRIYSDEMVNLHKGQGMDIYWRDNAKCPSEQLYLEMIRNKTGGLLRLAVKLMQCCSDKDIDFVPLVNLLGELYQIRDDYINLVNKDYHKNKSFCEDLSEGKFSFPIIHSISQTPNDSKLLNILKSKPQQVEVKEYAVSLMEQTGTFEYTRQYIHNIAQQSIKAINELGGNQILQQIVQYLTSSL
ncbi:hypothetical protein MIR68_010549 [Amoeboaphelidium protococcarum]|nr:hypothetical protein MIR68_010549 [Amoeboaphelidium protococcarum]